MNWAWTTDDDGELRRDRSGGWPPDIIVEASELLQKLKPEHRRLVIAWARGERWAAGMNEAINELHREIASDAREERLIARGLPRGKRKPW